MVYQGDTAVTHLSTWGERLHGDGRGTMGMERTKW